MKDLYFAPRARSPGKVQRRIKPVVRVFGLHREGGGWVPEARMDGKGKGAATVGSGQPHPPNLPPLGGCGGASWSRGSASSFQRLRLTDVGTGARPPRLPSWGQGGLGRGRLFPDSAGRGLSTTRFSPPWPAECTKFVHLTAPCTRFGLYLDYREALGFQPCFLAMGGCSTAPAKRGPELRPPVCRSPGFDALSTCLDVSLSV